MCGEIKTPRIAPLLYRPNVNGGRRVGELFMKGEFHLVVGIYQALDVKATITGYF
jgi:hypothetical protein